MTHSRLTDEEFAALDEALWNALGGRCACGPDDRPCKRDLAQTELLAWVLGRVALFRATWGESLE